MEKLGTTSEAILQALDRGESLPSVWYTDAAITQRETERIFRNSWQYVGSLNQLAAVGDFVTAEVGGVPVVVVRTADRVSGLINVCRHRRHEVMKGCGNAKVLQCPYHAWTYDLNGILKAAPRADREPNFCVDDYPLLKLKVNTLGPWVFANLDENSQPLSQYFGAVLDVIAGSGIDLNSMELWSREQWQSDSNWKTMLENFLECYHCQVAHPGFSAAVDVDQDNYQLTTHGYWFSQIGNVRSSAVAGLSKVEIYDVKGEIKQAQYHLLWPNFTININPGFPNISIDVWRPDGPNRTTGVSEQYFGPGVDKKWAEEVVRFNKAVGEEDDKLTNSVQRGLLAGMPAVGRSLINSEHLMIEFQKLVVKAICD
ncbi:MAG TPA: aromatic ring-hydroxylating dioxygenase subunit alpha [Candidatus Obscuribacterales bacterium]